MAETWLEKCESVSIKILNGNNKDAKILLKSYNRKQQYKCISYIKGFVDENTLWKYIKICIEGDFS